MATAKPIGVRRISRPGPWALAGFVLLALALVGCTKTSYQYRWDFFVDSVFRPDQRIWDGLILTVCIAVTAQILGVLLGVFGALGKLTRFLPLRILAEFYVWLFRGTPLLVQIMFLYYGLGVTGIFRWPDIDILGLTIAGKVQAGIFALGVNEGAYMTEIVRAGILAIDPGQTEAAKSLGMTYGQAMRRVVLPQAARVIVPPLGNEFNNMLKTTSLLVIISVEELFVTFQNLNASGRMVFHPFELFLACAVWFLLLTTIWSLIQGRIERRLARGAAGSTIVEGRSLRSRLFGMGRAGGERTA